MAKKYSVVAIATLLFILLISYGCSKEDMKAQKPVYFSIPEMYVNTDYSLEGTSHQKITTVWILVNGKSIGAYELPATPPILLEEGENTIRFFEGINLNGVSASRVIYDGLASIDTTINYSPEEGPVADTLTFNNLTTEYQDFRTITIVEDFDRQGLRLKKTNRSDTNIIKSSDPSEYFINPQDPGEDNGKCGVLYTSSKSDLAEVASTEAYDLPGGGSNVYLEINYRCNIPFTVGIITETSGGIVQAPTVRVNPKTEWNKIYINLVTEVSSYPDNDGFKVYFAAEHEDGMETGFVFLDNIKIVY